MYNSELWRGQNMGYCIKALLTMLLSLHLFLRFLHIPLLFSWMIGVATIPPHQHSHRRKRGQNLPLCNLLHNKTSNRHRDLHKRQKQRLATMDLTATLLCVRYNAAHSLMSKHNTMTTLFYLMNALSLFSSINCFSIVYYHQAHSSYLLWSTAPWRSFWEDVG